MIAIIIIIFAVAFAVIGGCWYGNKSRQQDREFKDYEEN